MRRSTRVRLVDRRVIETREGNDSGSGQAAACSEEINAAGYTRMCARARARTNGARVINPLAHTHNSPSELPRKRTDRPD